MYYLGTLHVLAGHTYARSRSSSSLLLMLYGPLESLTYTAWAMEGAAAGAHRCFEVLDREDDVHDAPDARSVHRLGVRFRSCPLSATPPTSGFAAHRSDGSRPEEMVRWSAAPAQGRARSLDLSRVFTIRPRPRALDGRDLRLSRRNHCARQSHRPARYAPLFYDHARNIAYGRPEATQAEILEAARRAQAHDFISRMPDGFDRPVGERGGHLSVGQRQRIGIARAFLKNAPILLLDEPTCALDPATEAAIMVTIEDLMRGRTTLIVTHRLATIHGVEESSCWRMAEIAEEGRGLDLWRAGIYAPFIAPGIILHPST